VNKRSNSELDSLPRCRKQRTPEMWSHHPGLNAAEHSVGNAIQWSTDTSDPRHFGTMCLVPMPVSQTVLHKSAWDRELKVAYSVAIVSRDVDPRYIRYIL